MDKKVLVQYVKNGEASNKCIPVSKFILQLIHNVAILTNYKNACFYVYSQY